MFVNADDQNIFSQQCANSSGDENDEDADLFYPSGVDTHSAENLANESDEYPQPNKRRFFYAKNFVMSIVAEDPTLVFERSSLGTAVKLNTLLKLHFELFKINFIHDYNFAKLIDHVLNLKKCLVKLHSFSRKPNVEMCNCYFFYINYQRFQPCPISLPVIIG